MQRSIILAENFYEDPLKIRELALKLNYGAAEGHTYPGVNSDQAFLPDEVINKFSSLVGNQVVPANGMLCGNFRLSNVNDTHTQDIHVDPGADWAAVLFLNLPDQCQGGTNFWRHKKYGIEECPRSEEEALRYGCHTFKEIQEKFIYGDGVDRSLWDLTINASMRFNRVVLFRPWMWHSHGCNFGTTRENSRLVQLFFFNEVNSQMRVPEEVIKNTVTLSPVDQMINEFIDHRTNKDAPIMGTPDHPIAPKYFFEE